MKIFTHETKAKTEKFAQNNKDYIRYIYTTLSYTHVTLTYVTEGEKVSLEQEVLEWGIGKGDFEENCPTGWVWLYDIKEEEEVLYCPSTKMVITNADFAEHDQF